MPQQHNPGRHVQSLTLPQSRHNHRNTSAYIFPTVPTPRTTPPTPGTASPRRRAPTLQLPVATRPLHSKHSPAAAQRFHRSDASEHPAEHRPHIVPTPRPPADTGPRLAAGHCPASPPGPNAPTPRRNAPAPFKAHTCRRTPVPTAPTPRTTPPTPASPTPPGPQHPSPPIKGTPLPPRAGPPPPGASDHPADTRTRHAPGTASPRRRDPTLQLPVATLPLHSRHTPAAAQRPHTVPTLGPPRRRRIQPHRRAQKNPALRAGPIHLSVIFQ